MKFVVPSIFLFLKFAFLPSSNLVAWMLIAILFDFVTGILKAVIKKQQRTSTAMRRTIIKFLQYAGAIVAALIINNVAKEQGALGLEKIMQYSADAIVVFIIYIEVVSIFENLNEIDSKSTISKYFFKPFHKLLTLQLKNNPFVKITDEATKTNVLFFIVFGFGLLVASTSCNRRQVPQQPVVQKITDTITIKQVDVYFDTIVKTKADTLIIVDSINCDDAKVSVGNDKSNINATIKNGILTIKAIQPQKEIPISVKKEVQVVERVHNEIKEIPIEVTKIEYKVPKWCWLLLIANIAYLVFKYRSVLSRLILKILK